MNISALVQASNDAANAMLRCACMGNAQEMTDLFVQDIINAMELEGAVAKSTLRVARLLYTMFQDCNDTVVDSASLLGQPQIETLLHVSREAVAVDDSEMFSYIEKAMATRMRVLPLELRPTIMEVVGSTARLFVKNVMEEVRATVIYEYQFHNLLVNLAFILSICKALLQDVTDLRTVIEETVKTAFERCLGATPVEEEVQKKEIEKALEDFIKFSRKFCVCLTIHLFPPFVIYV